MVNIRQGRRLLRFRFAGKKGLRLKTEQSQRRFCRFFLVFDLSPSQFKDTTNRRRNTICYRHTSAVWRPDILCFQKAKTRQIAISL